MRFQLPNIPFLSFSSPPSRITRQDYLNGLGGIFAIQSFPFVFFQTFLPAAVADSKNTISPLYQTILRKTLSVVFWNESLIYSFIILLSARTICLPFLADSNRTVCASSIFRRGIRLWMPTFIAFSVSAIIFSTTSTRYITDFLNLTGNVSAAAPMPMHNFLVYFNSLIDLFWLTNRYSSQAANLAFPSGTLWIVSALSKQSYTVYMTMIIVPYTRPSWRVKALCVFIATAWWVQSWAWYSVTGLLLADAVMNMSFQFKSSSGLEIGKFGIPMWPVYSFLLVAGGLLQYLFISWRPQYSNEELKGHTGLYSSGSVNEGLDLDQPQARDDNFMIVLGFMLLVETYEGVQKVLRNRVLAVMGRRSYSVFLVQPLIVYTVGIKLYMHMYATGENHETTTFVCFIVCLPLVALVSEIFYRIVDIPSVAVARETWAWMRK